MMAPMSFRSSSGSPTLNVASFVARRSRNPSYTLLWRKRREPAVQDWPCRAKRIPAMTPSTVRSLTASGNRIWGLLPPSSSVTGTMRSAASRRIAFPVSVASVRAGSSTFASTSSAMRSSARPRSRAGTARQEGNAAAAARTARSTSAAPERGTCATTFPRCAGVSTSKVRPSALSTHSPPTSIFSRVGLATALISGLHHIPIHVRAPVPVELPGVPHLAYEIQIEVGDEELLVFLRSLRDDLAARVREVARAVVVVRTELFLLSDTIDRPHPVAVRDGMGGLLDEPKVHRQPARGGRGNEDELRSVKAEHPRALGEVAVVADVHADLPHGGVENRLVEV